MPELHAPGDLPDLARSALHNLHRTNTLPDATGRRLIRAGGGYPTPWTRDASLNSLSAASLLDPDAARDTLLAVCDRDRGLVQQDNQWWDRILWAVAAQHHHAVTGDREFLAEAYRIATATFDLQHAERYDEAFGLYRGPSVMQDGISGFPDPSADRPGASSFVLDHPGTERLLCLSTNAAYAGALDATARMADALGHHQEGLELRRRMIALCAAINLRLWREDVGTYGYFTTSEGPDAGRIDPHQEAIGLAFALRFGVADADRATRLLAAVRYEPRGIANVAPHFARYDDARPGRHNLMCWPMVMGQWAEAVAAPNRTAEFARALDHLTALLRSDPRGMFELYDPNTGAVHGGWQVGREWPSEPDQTWSATALIGAVHHGLLGMLFTSAGLRFTPCLPPGSGTLALTGLRWRAAVLDIEVTGTGTHPQRLELDGQPVPVVPHDLSGDHIVRVVMGDS